MEKKSVNEQVEDLKKKRENSDPIYKFKKEMVAAGIKPHQLVNADLIIGRVPRIELKWFKAWADEQFESDYGMAFKWLCQGFMPPVETQLMEVISVLSDRLDKAEILIQNLSAKESSEGKTIKLGNGRIIKRS